ncbi:hypothetical protein [Natrinema halophilum]|uniref:Uncharacterized protein n=1 Tax=Natrinema halophilum TaxID=1699371 RepID=A0A7D5KSX5_9EURY|nr:hypothetical protein [Natrinema halophilum]QLG49884.1 hypothetical protein HYG82_13975 [Natrinema halophilum]
MSITVNLKEDQSVQVTDQVIETKPPARVAFAAEGVITMTRDVLEEFAGSSLRPVEIEMAIGESETVNIDLSKEASLRLDTVDIGVESPDTNDLSPGMDTIPSSSDDNSDVNNTHPGAIAFTVEGVIRDTPEEVRKPITDASPRLEAITFAAKNALRSDGGSGTDIILEVSLLGYGISIHRNGVIDIGTGSDVTDVGLP